MTEEMIAEAIDAGEVNAELNENELDNVAGDVLFVILPVALHI